MFKWMNRNNWKKLEQVYNELKINPDSFIVACRTAFINDIYPFQFEKSETATYKRLVQIATNYKETKRLKEFYEHLQEGQYYINIWTAFFLIDGFDLNKDDKLTGLKDNEYIFDYCYHLIENNFQDFKDSTQVKNCSYWLEEKRCNRLA
jgi:hypothetical protein